MAKDSILGVIDILNEYKQDVQEGIAKSAEEVAKHGRDELKRTSPKKTGSYRKGWSIHTSKTMYNIETIIHNKTNYQLTHLLEKPHATRNGGVTTPIVHIKPVEQKCIAEFEKDVESIIENGG